ncbi:YihY/virulence factor BrkB family protein [Bosea sp. AAP35]|uniref:YihY/virulence factor BrkB family protein n=1 Tax=Bosea sp. AAP35 TaxID=1523417 RepID=UPI000A6738C9|nr:YihY/virulence factor BrkB family protein [Bosea sp. AAP35]
MAALLGVSSAYVFSRLAGPAQNARDQRYDEKTARRSAEGVEADAPSDIPAGGWWDIARRTYHEVDRDRVRAVAAGVTFYGLLALFPALTALVSLYGLVADPAAIAEQSAALDGFLPGGATDFLREQIARITAGGETKLGFALLISLSVAIWSANAGVKAIFDALNVAYGEDEKRGFIKLNLVSLAFTLGIILFVLGAIGAIAVIPILLDYLYLGGAAEWLIAIGRWPVVVGILLLGLSALYRYGPSRDQARWAWVSPGAVFAAVTWLVASLLFSWYVANFEDYNATYGTVGAVIGLLTWMWLSATIVLVGAELNSEAERQTYLDTTKGTPMPVGMRGADAADRKE